MDLLLDMMMMVNELNSGVITKFNAVKKIIDTITEDMDPILIKILMCLKRLIETLPNITQRTKIEECELCSRHLQGIFQTLFDSDSSDLIFKWMDAVAFLGGDNKDRGLDKSVTDGCVENDLKTIGHVEVETIESTDNYHSINVDLYRLGIFGKTAIIKYNLKTSFEVMAVGTNLQFYICQKFDGVYVMTELDSIRTPMSLDELPQLIPYLNRLYNVVKAIHVNCYGRDNTITEVDRDDSKDTTLEPKVLKAITGKTVGRN